MNWHFAVQEKTERFLTWRRRREWRKRERQKRLHPVQGWAEAIFGAMLYVLLINQYFVQLYVIPSRSMENTLLVGDRVAVNKLIYGPELLPFFYKLRGYKEPARGDVVIFLSPEYEPKSPLYGIAQRLIYMMTITLVDIDRFTNNANPGQPVVQLLVKRAVGFDENILCVRDGDLFVKPRGEKEFIDEKSFSEMDDSPYHVKRDFKPGEVSDYIDIPIERARNINPHSRKDVAKWGAWHQGQYVPRDFILPLGDNRDNSKDGRSFGPVRKNKFLGKASMVLWPLNRFGGIN